MAHDVFISYSSKDKLTADAVCATLESRAIRCWIAPRDVQPGQPYGEAIIDAIHGCRVMVLVLSSHANVSGHIPKEVERAVSNGVTIIPLRIEDVTPAKSLDYFIASVHWLDAMTPPLEKHLANLAETIDKIVPGRPAGPTQVLPAGIPARPPSTVTSALPTEKRRVLIPWIYAGGAAALAVVVIFGVLNWRQKINTPPSASVDITEGSGVRPDNPGAIGMVPRSSALVVPSEDPPRTRVTPAVLPEPGDAVGLRERGLYYRDDGRDYDLAIRYFDQAIRLQPDFPEALANRGDTYLWKGDFDQAAEDYSEVIRLNPGFAGSFHRRGVIRLLLSQFRPAQEDLGLAIESNQPNPDRVYDPIWLYLAEAKNGQNAKPNLVKYASRLNLTVWPGPLASLFLGQSTPDSVLMAAKDPDPQTNERQQCQAYFFVGEYLLLAGQRANAVQLFQQALATRQMRQFAYLAARSELDRFQAQR